MNIQPNALNVLKGLGAVAGVGIAGFGAYKAVEHFKSQNEASQPTEDATQADNAEVTTVSEATSDNTSSVPSTMTAIDAVALETYPEYLSTTFPKLEIREGSIFDYDGKNYMLIEGVDVKFEDNPRQQAILSVLANDAYHMVASATVSGDKISYNHKEGSVYIGVKQGDTVKSFSGQGSNEQIDNFDNDFVIAL